ncbi:MAG: sigma-70 family RNA polymerase sigma factor [Clostridia bacterium]|nr:sigma-70 family RNA polymerase sigma factor [Clostridia bacterium]
MASTLEKAKQGDAQAFAELYGMYAKDFYRFALCMLKVREDAEDAVQDAALSVYKHILNIKKDDAFKAYFFTVLANECRARLKKREIQKTVPLDDFVPALADASAENLSLSLELQQAVSKLKDEERTIVLLSALAGFKSGQIADITGLTSGGVRSKLSRSLRLLREELSK